MFFRAQFCTTEIGFFRKRRLGFVAPAARIFINWRERHSLMRISFHRSDPQRRPTQSSPVLAVSNLTKLPISPCKLLTINILTNPFVLQFRPVFPRFCSLRKNGFVLQKREDDETLHSVSSPGDSFSSPPSAPRTLTLTPLTASADLRPRAASPRLAGRAMGRAPRCVASSPRPPRGS